MPAASSEASFAQVSVDTFELTQAVVQLMTGASSVLQKQKVLRQSHNRLLGGVPLGTYWKNLKVNLKIQKWTMGKET